MARDGLSYIAQYFVLPTSLWYLLALALYFLLTKIFSKAWGWGIVLGGTLTVVSILGVIPEYGNLPSLTQNFFWFFVGWKFQPIFSNLTKSMTVGKVFSGLGLYVAAGSILVFIGSREPVTFTVASAAGIFFGLGISQLVSRKPVLIVRSLIHIGKNTLPIYVLHMPILAALDRWLPWSWFVKMGAGVGTTFFSAILLCVLVISLTLVTYRGLNRVAPFLFRSPWLLRK